MTEEMIPKNTRELYFFVKGQFDGIKQEIRNTRKFTFWIGGLTGGVVSGLIILAFKIFFKGV